MVIRLSMGALAVKLAGPFAPGQFAQLGQLAQVPGASSIGTVEKLSGVSYAHPFRWDSCGCVGGLCGFLW